MSGDPAGPVRAGAAKVGPIDLGNVIVPVRLQLRSNGGLNATADDPAVRGRRADLAAADRLTVDRGGFMRNPTGCGRRSSSGDVRRRRRRQRHDPRGVHADRLQSRSASRRAFAMQGRRERRDGRRRPSADDDDDHAGRRAGRHQLGARAASESDAVELGRARPGLHAGGVRRRQMRQKRAKAAPQRRQPVRGRAAARPRLPRETRRGQLPKLVAQLRGPLVIDMTGCRSRSTERNKIVTTFGTCPTSRSRASALRLPPRQIRDPRGVGEPLRGSCSRRPNCAVRTARACSAARRSR